MIQGDGDRAAPRGRQTRFINRGGTTRRLSPPRGPRGGPRPKNDNWHMWTDLTVRVRGLPGFALTVNVFDILNSEGNISRIDLGEYPDGTRTGDAFVTFTPPPARPFWDLVDWKIVLEEHSAESFPLTITCQERRSSYGHPSPVDASKTYPQRMILHPTTIDIGFMHQQDKMMTMQTVPSSKKGAVTMMVNLLRRELVIEFTLVVPDATWELSNSKTERIKFQIPFHQLDIIWEFDEKFHKALVITLDRPPAFYRRLHDEELSFNDGRHWHERFRWARMTEISRHGHEPDKKPLRLKKTDHVIDIGRWTTYRLSFNERDMNQRVYLLMKNVLIDYNVKFLRPNQFITIPRTNATVWDWIDLSESARSTRETFLEIMCSDARHLPWPIRYQLESCISQGCLNERNITKEFIQHLETESDALTRLETAADQKKRIFDPMDLFSMAIPRTSLKKMPRHCILQRSATITPSTIYFGPPTVEMSNRILRQYSEHSDRFLRVRFTDEKFEGRIHATDDDTQDSVFTRIYNCLTRGIMIGDRHFEFLATGNSQFREHGAYFFASTPTLTASTIREQLGTIGKVRNNVFVPEKVVAKYASRLGQCFSTTHPIRGMKIKVVEIADVERNGYNFTDGVGKLSGFVAQMIATELNLRDSFLEPPSLFQIRMGGIKGVVAASPDVKGHEMHVRPSQYKFAAVYEGLEVIRWSSYSVPRLNRQLISVLRSLHIPDTVFLQKLKTELYRLDAAMTSEAVALSMLQEQIDFNQMTLTLASIIHDGFIEVQDPFASSILNLWRAWSTKMLKDKAALTIPQGAFLLGCTDETATLRGYFENTIYNASPGMDRIKSLPEIFVQITDPDPNRKGCYKVIEDVCIVARNPSLHPGDIRVVRAVNVPKLHHLRDVVVFPQTGDRDIQNMCSGGDLDGDDFIVVWDKDLIPPPEQWDVPAMDFTAPTPREVDQVTLNDLVSFFVIYMKTDTLRTIATSHLACADQLPGGVSHPNCLKLAEEHSTAVDYPKSGIPPQPIHKLRPFKYPHFMANRHRAKDRIYHSKTILGQLYDAVPQPDFMPMVHFPFDRRVLDAYVLDEGLIDAATKVKGEYDAAMRRIMAQHEIKTEFEVWTTFVMDHAQLSSDYKFHEEIGRVSASLKEQFTEVCIQRAGGKDYEILAPFVAAMYSATAREVDIALETFDPYQPGQSTNGTAKANEFPFVSFPWLFHRELGKIARGPRAAVSDSLVALQGATKRHTRKAVQLIHFNDDEDKIETEEGITHRGDLLALDFQSKEGYEPTQADHYHAATEGYWDALSLGPQLDARAAIEGAFPTISWNYDDSSPEELVMEDGEIADDDVYASDDMEGVEQEQELDMNTVRALESEFGSQLVAPGLLGGRLEPIPLSEKTTTTVFQAVTSNGLNDGAVTTGGDADKSIAEGNEETQQEVIIDMDHKPSPLDILQGILSR